LFYKNQKEVANALNILVDEYLNNEIEENNFIENINKIFKSNDSKVIKNNEFTPVIIQRCGKRRLEILSKIINFEVKNND
jgi:uncharacterized protein (TIGR04540 family)